MIGSMILFNFILWILCSFGIVRIIQRGSIFYKLRNRLELAFPKVYNFMMCVQCFSFWISILVFFAFPFIPIYLFPLVGPIGSVLCEIIDLKIF